MAECEHQSKVIDEAQKTFVLREMLPKDSKRECLTEPRTFSEIRKKLEIIMNETMATEGPVPMDLGNVSGLNHLVSRNAGGAQWTWNSGAAENVMPRNMFSEIGIRHTERPKNEKGLRGPGTENIKNYGQHMSVKTPDKREKASGVSLPHHPSWERSVHWVRGVVLGQGAKILCGVAQGSYPRH